MTHVDNAAAVQVGLALLLIALVGASTLLVLGVILQSITQARAAGRRLARLTSDIAQWDEGIGEAFRTARTQLAQTSAQTDDLERRLTMQEPE